MILRRGKMINNRMNEGVGKKIVEALKKQNDIEIVPVAENTPEIENVETNSFEDNSLENEALDIDFSDEDLSVDSTIAIDETTPQMTQIKHNTPLTSSPIFEETLQTISFSQPQLNINSTANNSVQNFAKDLDDFEVPANVAVLKQLITQLPSGVTKQTGAQIIRQTMEALGISMKSVLQEAQQVQESINSSARECQANIMENKRQIVLLENQVQKYTRQSAALNDIISLFIQTGN